jgi:DNA-binding HxlR family transcriptional regulator
MLKRHLDRQSKQPSVVLDGTGVPREVVDDDREDNPRDVHAWNHKGPLRPVDTHSKVSGAARKVSSSNFVNQQGLADACVANEVLTRIALRWKMSVLNAIDSGACSFGALKRTHPTVSDQVLAKRLRELTEEDLLIRHARADGSVSYTVTDRGVALLPIVRALCSWAVA